MISTCPFYAYVYNQNWYTTCSTTYKNLGIYLILISTTATKWADNRTNHSDDGMNSNNTGADADVSSPGNSLMYNSNVFANFCIKKYDILYFFFIDIYTSINYDVFF